MMIINEKVDNALIKIEEDEKLTVLVELTWHELLLLKRLIKQEDTNTKLLEDSVMESKRLRKILNDY